MSSNEMPSDSRAFLLDVLAPQGVVNPVFNVDGVNFDCSMLSPEERRDFVGILGDVSVYDNSNEWRKIVGELSLWAGVDRSDAAYILGGVVFDCFHLTSAECQRLGYFLSIVKFSSGVTGEVSGDVNPLG